MQSVTGEFLVSSLCLHFLQPLGTPASSSSSSCFTWPLQLCPRHPDQPCRNPPSLAVSWFQKDFPQQPARRSGNRPGCCWGSWRFPNSSPPTAAPSVADSGRCVARSEKPASINRLLKHKAIIKPAVCPLELTQDYWPKTVTTAIDVAWPEYPVFVTVYSICNYLLWWLHLLIKLV